jgi:hypothetical protein
LTVVSLRFPWSRAWWWRVGLYAGFCSDLAVGDDHPSRLTVTRPLLRPTRGGPPAVRQVAGGPPIPSARPCSGWGLPSRRSHPRRWCALTAPFHPYLCDRNRHRRSVLCGTFLRVAPTGCYPAPCPVESGRSSAGSPRGPGRGHPADSPPSPLLPAAGVGRGRFDVPTRRITGRLRV